jgi:hypothetical protein
VTEKEIKEFDMNVGFLSTSLLEGVTERFKKNLLMVIKVPLLNLKGVFDNGFADISHTSSFSTEK